MKRFCLLAVLLLISSAVNSEIVSLKFKAEKFDDDKYVIKYYSDIMDLVDVKPMTSQTYDYAFRDKDGRYEIRYILFSQTDDIPDAGDYKVQAALWAVMVIGNVTGDENAAQNTSAFNEEDVKSEFNADCGFTNFSIDGKTDFTEGYKFVMINFYCKRDVGIMCQTILFNDIDFVKDKLFIKIFHGFRFY